MSIIDRMYQAAVFVACCICVTLGDTDALTDYYRVHGTD